jgi:hypothetical protein
MDQAQFKVARANELRREISCAAGLESHALQSLNDVTTVETLQLAAILAAVDSGHKTFSSLEAVDNGTRQGAFHAQSEVEQGQIRCGKLSDHKMAVQSSLADAEALSRRHMIEAAASEKNRLKLEGRRQAGDQPNIIAAAASRAAVDADAAREKLMSVERDLEALIAQVGWVALSAASICDCANANRQMTNACAFRSYYMLHTLAANVTRATAQQVRRCGFDDGGTSSPSVST